MTPPDPAPAERMAELVTESWAGRCWEPCVIVGETPTRYRVKAPHGYRLRLAGRRRFISGELTALVPKCAVKLFGGSR
jgi:hypothetical protein